MSPHVVLGARMIGRRQPFGLHSVLREESGPDASGAKKFHAKQLSCRQVARLTGQIVTFTIANYVRARLVRFHANEG